MYSEKATPPNGDTPWSKIIQTITSSKVGLDECIKKGNIITLWRFEDQLSKGKLKLMGESALGLCLSNESARRTHVHHACPFLQMDFDCLLPCLFVVFSPRRAYYISFVLLAFIWALGDGSYKMAPLEGNTPGARQHGALLLSSSEERVGHCDGDGKCEKQKRWNLRLKNK